MDNLRELCYNDFDLSLLDERRFPMSNQKLSTQPYKGTRDFYPNEMKLRNWFFGKIRETLTLAAFDEYNGPILESL